MDDDVGESQEPPITGRWMTTSSYDIYMVYTPKETNGDEATEDNPSGRKAKHGRRRRRSKPRLDRDNSHTNPAIEQDEPADDEHAFEQASEQGNLDKQT